jgi:hypothetical protein
MFVSEFAEEIFGDGMPGIFFGKFSGFLRWSNKSDLNFLNYNTMRQFPNMLKSGLLNLET